jgi:hypothetical protein
MRKGRKKEWDRFTCKVMQLYNAVRDFACFAPFRGYRVGNLSSYLESTTIFPI